MSAYFSGTLDVEEIGLFIPSVVVEVEVSLVSVK